MPNFVTKLPTARPSPMPISSGNKAISKVIDAAERASSDLIAANCNIGDIKVAFGAAMLFFGSDSPEMQRPRGEFAQIYTLLKSICAEMEAYSRLDIVLFDMVQAQNRGNPNGEKV